MIPATANAPFQNLLSLEMESTETAELVDDSAIPQIHTTQYNTRGCGTSARGSKPRHRILNVRVREVCVSRLSSTLNLGDSEELTET